MATQTEWERVRITKQRECSRERMREGKNGNRQ